MAQLWTISGLAVELSKDRRTLVRDLEGLQPDFEETAGNGRVTRKWRLARVFAHLMGNDDGELDPNEQRARKDKESADRLALQNAATRGEFGVITEVSEWYGSHVDRCCTRLEQIPDALGQFCDPTTAAVIVPECRRLIHEARAELAADPPAGHPVDLESVEAAADADGERVVGREPQALKRKQRRPRPVAN